MWNPYSYNPCRVIITCMQQHALSMCILRYLCRLSLKPGLQSRSLLAKQWADTLTGRKHSGSNPAQSGWGYRQPLLANGPPEVGGHQFGTSWADVKRCKEGVRRLTPRARRYQVRRSWVRIPVPATFFTHEISVKVYLQWNLYTLHVIRVKCINLSCFASGWKTWHLLDFE